MINTKEQITQKELQKKYGGEIIKGKLVFNNSVYFSGCTSLISIPKETVFNGSADFRCCTSLISIPEGTVFNDYADFSGCTSLRPIPKHLIKVKNLYIFPNINWNNIEWINKILGDKLTAEEVFAIDNIEHRRIA